MPPAPIQKRLAALALAHPVWLILLAVVAQHAPLITARDLWWSDEVRHGGVLLDLASKGDWWALHLNGAPYTDKPPLYFLFLAGVQRLFGAGPVPIFFGLSLTVFAYALACWHLARRLLGEGALALGSVAVLLSGSYILAASHYARMDFLFSAAIVLAWSSFYTASVSPALDRRAILAGFVFVTLATLIKGPVGVLLPLAALIGQLAVQGRVRLLADRAVLGGAGILAAGLAFWAGGLIYFGGADYLARLFDRQIVGRTLDTRGGVWGYLRYFWAFPAVLLPYSLLLLRRWPKTVVQPATRYLLICIATGLLGLSLIGEKHEYYLIPLLVPAAILLVQVVAGLPARRLGQVLALWLGLQSGLLLATPAVIAGLHLPADHLAPALGQAVLPAVMGLALALGLALATRGLLRHWSAVLAAFLAAQTLFGGALLGRVMPALDPVLSPATLAGAMRPAIDQGYAPAILHGIPGVFAFHLGQHYTALFQLQAVDDWLAVTPRAVIALQLAEAKALSARHADFQTLACVPFLGQVYIVLARPSGLDAAPRAQPMACPAP